MFEQKCEKCGMEMYRIALPGIKLIGGVHTVLCERCVTKWNEFASQHPVFQRLRELECVRNSIVSTRELSADRSDPALHQVLEMIRELEAILHEEGLKWVGRESGKENPRKEKDGCFN